MEPYLPLYLPGVRTHPAPLRHLRHMDVALGRKPETDQTMCRNIRTLYNFQPPATEDEIRASALQFVRKLSGFTRPSNANEDAFNRAVDAVTEAAHELLASLVTTAPPRDRDVEAAKARARSAARFR